MQPQVAVDCSPLLVRSAGVKTWLYHWVRALRASGLVSVETFLEPPDRGLILACGPYAHPLLLAQLSMLRYAPFTASQLLARKCDVFHASNLLHAVPKGKRLSSTVHDLTAWTVPQCHRQSQIRADAAWADRILRHADGLIAVSEHSRRDAVEILGLNPENIRVIYPGVSGEYFDVAQPQIDAALLAIGISRPYFFFNGTIEPRKNVGTLLDAWMLLAPDIRRSTELILAGMPGWDCEGVIRRMAQMQKDGDGVRYLGFIAPAFLPGLTAGALAMVYPSLYEGFGFPVAQAMAAGCPVITSNVSSLPEIAAGACRLIDPRSASEMATAMLTLLSEEQRKSLAAAGIRRAALFTWSHAADESADFFNRLCS